MRTPLAGRSVARAFPFAACLIALALAAAAQGQRGNSAEFTSAADALVNAAVKPDAPGVTVIVVKDGRPLYRTARGMASLELGVPLQPDSVLRIGSVTKQFTSAAVMMLVEQGKVSLDDDITRFFPDYPVKGRRITVEHLLTHTSGIKSYTSLPAWRGVWGKDFTSSSLIDLFKDEPMDFEPGEKYLYNNSAYFLLGALVEKAAGVPYFDFVGRNIFTPLGMSHTGYGDTGRLLNGRAQGYAPYGTGFVNAPYLSMTQPGAAGALVSTVDDLAKWDAAVSAGKLLSASSWQRIFTPYRLRSGRSTGYGFGWWVGAFDGHPVQEHAGGIHGFSAYVVRLPEDRAYVAVLANCSNTNTASLARKLAALAIGKPLVNPPAVALTPEQLSLYSGSYEFADEKVTVTALPGGLAMQRPTGPPTQLVPMGGDRFFVRDSFVRVAFERDASGQVNGLTMTTWNTVEKAARR